LSDTLQDFAMSPFTEGGHTRSVYRKGSGPGVIVIHEMPGITPRVADFGRAVAEAGMTAVLPSLFGTPGRSTTVLYGLRSIVGGCVSREFATWAGGKTSPVIVWLRALARQVHEECGGPGVGAVGMCFTGGFALAMMVDDRMVAPVLSQPSLPFAVGRSKQADLGLSPDDRARVQERAAAGCDVLGLRYAGDALVGRRFDSLRELLGEHFIAVEFEGKGHSVLTEDLQEEGVAKVLDFLRERLLTPA
jgi:dienelactone hydrolase